MNSAPGSARSHLLTFILTALLGATANIQAQPIKIEVNAIEAPRKLLHARLTFPVKPGDLTLLYPKWIPGEHSPSGPVTDLTGVKMKAGGKPVPWRRDADDMFTFHVQVPEKATTLDVELDYLYAPSTSDFSSGASATAQLMVLSWNQVLLYPKGLPAAEIRYAPSLVLLPGWKFGTALEIARQSATSIEFAPVSLETLVDSPVIAGSHFLSIDLAPGTTPRQALDVVADSADALEIKPELEGHFKRLVAEAAAIFGAQHFRTYHFLLTLSDHVAHFGLEHHESSDDRSSERFLTDDDALMLDGFLLPHEMVHSWNGKYRRPVGLATPDFQQPMDGELLWVYEGLTDYLGILLAARSGIWTNDSFNEYLAYEAALLDVQPGRSWRPLSDTATAAQLLYFARKEGTAWRRSVDYYPEGDLIWLEVDTLIRQKTQGKKSIEDFCRKFHGGESGPPKVVPYKLEDVVAALNEVAPNDWRGLFQKRVYSTNPRAPFEGILASGWRVTYTNVQPAMLKSKEASEKLTDLSFSIGLTVKEDGYIEDVVPGLPAAVAGIAPTMKLMAVNGRHWTAERLRAALKDAVNSSEPIELLVENEEYYVTCKLDYHGGEKYPQLERDDSKPDLLGKILKPLTATGN
jgi:predicted metalloprotease with PDZ domain